MYIWVGIKTEDHLLPIKEAAMKAEKAVGFESSCYTLPMHISLKMSFSVSEADFISIISDIEKLLSSISPFTVKIKGVETEDVIVWIRMEDDYVLNGIHDSLNTMLLSKYGIGLHEYDCDYKFHTTLFMDEDSDKLKKAYELIKDSPIPREMHLDTFVIGTSDSGRLGTYTVIKEIKV